MDSRKSLFYLFSGLGILLVVGIWAWSVNRTIENAGGAPTETPATPQVPQEVAPAPQEAGRGSPRVESGRRSLPSIGETIREGLGSIREILENLSRQQSASPAPEERTGVKLPASP